MRALLKILTVAALAAVSVSAQAAIWANGAGNVAIVRNSAGLPVTLSLPTAGAPIANLGGGMTLHAAQTADVGGRSVALALQRSANAASIAALGGKLARMMGPVGIGMMVLDGLRWSVEQGMWVKDPTGDPTLVWLNVDDQGAFTSALLACQDSVGTMNRVQNIQPPGVASVEKRLDHVYRCYTSAISGGAIGEVRQVQKPSTETARPATDGEVDEAVLKGIQKNPEAGKPILGQAEQAGKLAELALDALKVDGPSSLPSQTTSSTSATGTTTTTTTIHITYSGDTVNITNITTTTRPDGTTTTTTTGAPAPGGGDDGEEEEPNPETVGPATDPDLPELPKLYERKYPGGLAGVWRDKSAAFKQTQFALAIAALTPNLGDGGCPQWTLPLNFGGRWNYGVVDFSVPCDVWAVLRILMLLFAVFVARGLIFGG